MSNPTVRLRAIEMELEKDQIRTEQSKVNSSWLKATTNKMVKAFGSLVIAINKPLTVVDYAYTNPLFETMHEIGLDVRALSSYQLSDVYLPQAVYDTVDINDDDDPQPDMTPDFPAVLTNSQKTYTIVSAIRRDTIHDGSGGGGNGGNGGVNEMGASYSSRPSTDYFNDHGRGATLEDDKRSQRSLDEQPRELTQIIIA
ncbi:hypothetical protein Cgig2_018982 [Carnegiea gigantea]|uniref:Uncharacterized protein n=1 Tax=Carnegiea gigantea TaxID=171969 RepID=A0A9Q1K1N5_9CARY|nr:hypothetical protein Cgig2_018982 [Carnegiea gigantea]